MFRPCDPFRVIPPVIRATEGQRGQELKHDILWNRDPPVHQEVGGIQRPLIDSNVHNLVHPLVVVPIAVPLIRPVQAIHLVVALDKHWLASVVTGEHSCLTLNGLVRSLTRTRRVPVILAMLLITAVRTMLDTVAELLHGQTSAIGDTPELPGGTPLPCIGRAATLILPVGTVGRAIAQEALRNALPRVTVEVRGLAFVFDRRRRGFNCRLCRCILTTSQLIGVIRAILDAVTLPPTGHTLAVTALEHPVVALSRWDRGGLSGRFLGLAVLFILPVLAVLFTVADLGSY